MRFPTTLTIALVALVAAACSKKEDAGADSCQKLGAHFSQLARAEADKLPADHPDKKAVMADLALVPKAAADLVKECRDEKWSAELRGCFLGAASADEFKAECSALLAKATPAAAPAAEPEAAKPEAAEPEAAKPEAAEPKAAEPEAAPTGDNE